MATSAEAAVNNNNNVNEKVKNQNNESNSSSSSESQPCVLTCLTWNIEGVTRNLHDLKQHVDREDPDLIFLQEPMCFQCDLTKVNDILGDKYCCILNSDDKFDPELPLQTNRAHGGCLTLYKKHLEPYISEVCSSSSRILPILLKIPGSRPSIHFNIYLPTAGKDAEFLDELSNLKNLIEDGDVSDNHIYVRGDADANASIHGRKNNTRDKLFKHFVEDQKLLNNEINHNTYHHFTGDGISDSSIDVLLESSPSQTEFVTKILCLKAESNIDSHHDIIISRCAIPVSDATIPLKPIEAPRVTNDRTKIIWSDGGIVQYASLLPPALSALRENWSDSSSPAEVEVLIEATNKILSSAAQHTNKTIHLGKTSSSKASVIPPEVKKTSKKQLSAHKHWLEVSENPNSSFQDKLAAKESFKHTRKEHRRAKRRQIAESEIKNTDLLHTILSKDPKRFSNH